MEKKRWFGRRVCITLTFLLCLSFAVVPVSFSEDRSGSFFLRASVVLLFGVLDRNQEILGIPHSGAPICRDS